MAMLSGSVKYSSGVPNGLVGPPTIGGPLAKPDAAGKRFDEGRVSHLYGLQAIVDQDTHHAGGVEASDSEADVIDTAASACVDRGVESHRIWTGADLEGHCRALSGGDG